MFCLSRGDDSIRETWRRPINLLKSTDCEQQDLFVVAVALAEDLDYVAPRETWHERVSGLRQQDPWTSKTYPQ